MKKKIEKIETEVDATTNSTNPDLKFEVKKIPIRELVFGQADLNELVVWLKELTEKVNKDV
jgi:hypothetical protein